MLKPLRINSQYQDYDSFAEQVNAWDVDFIQLKPGQFNSELFQYIDNNFLLTSANFNQLMHQRGGAPDKVWTFAILTSQSSDITWKNSHASQDAIIVYSPGSEIECISKPGFSVYTLSFSEQMITSIATYLIIDDIHSLLSQVKDSVQNVSVSELSSYRFKISNIVNILKTSGENQLTTNNLFAYDFLCAILKLLHLGKAEIQKPAINKRYQAIKKVTEFINDSESDKIINIPDLVEISGVSERTLCYAFQEHFGISPKSYLKKYRLNQLRKALFQASRKNNTVEQIARQFGFWHMGQLAKDYQQQFNEKPLVTLKNE